MLFFISGGKISRWMNKQLGQYYFVPRQLWMPHCCLLFIWMFSSKTMSSVSHESIVEPLHVSWIFRQIYSDSDDSLRTHQLSLYMKLLGSVTVWTSPSLGQWWGWETTPFLLGDSCSSPDYEIWGWKSIHQFGPFGTTLKCFIYLISFSISILLVTYWS
jgi:hypothetical protein